MDVVLPGMNGFQVTRATRATPRPATSRSRIVSTKGWIPTSVWGLRQGAKDYIVKLPRE